MLQEALQQVPLPASMAHRCFGTCFAWPQQVCIPGYQGVLHGEGLPTATGNVSWADLQVAHTAHEEAVRLFLAEAYAEDQSIAQRVQQPPAVVTAWLRVSLL